MRLAVFDTHRYDRACFDAANREFGHELRFLEPRLDRSTAALAQGCGGVVSFVNDCLDAPALGTLKRIGVGLVALRCAGTNHVDLEAASWCGLRVVRVPSYSPESVAEHAFALLLALARSIPRAHARVRDGNFSLEGLVGFELHGRTFGIVGAGRIGRSAGRIARGFGMKLVAYDLAPNLAWAEELGARFVTLEELLAGSDVVSLHLPLTPATHHLLDAQALARLRPGAVLLNTGRGALIDTLALIEALKQGHLRGVGLDVYEQEEGVFFQDLSGHPLQDDVLARLLSFPNVLVTSHQGFLTEEALRAIARTTLKSARDFEKGKALANEVRLT